MKIRLLGTGAAEGIPAFWADTFVSNYARENGGKDIRTRSGALVDGSLKLDLPPDTLMQMHRDRLDARNWTGLFFTHSDDDHFSPAEVQYGLLPFSLREALGYAIYGNAEICRRLRERYPAWPIEIHETKSFQPILHAEFVVTPVRANHKPTEDAHNYLIQRSGKTLLYATDTGIWGEETWEFLKGFQVDCLVLECTEGFTMTDYEGHLDAHTFLEIVQRLRAQGTVQETTVVCTTHHSHNGGATHEMLEDHFCPHGILVGYDGLEIEF